MSTTARKARKRVRKLYSYPVQAISLDGRVEASGRFQHPVKVGTPLEQRTKNVQRRDARLAREIDIANRRGWLSRLLFRTR
jgi:hypothetical protein